MRRLLFVLLLSATVHAQYTAAKIVFAGQSAYTPRQLEAAWEIKKGAAFTQNDLQNAAQHMIDSGAFEELSPQLQGPLKAITVAVTLKPVADSKLVPATFENFVWFTPQEVDAELRKRVPLYTGKLPEAGNLQEQVRTALVAMLAEKGVAAAISNLEHAPTPDQPISAVVYSITKPEIVLASAAIGGITPDMREAVMDVARRLLNKPYAENNGYSLQDQVLNLYRDNG